MCQETIAKGIWEALEKWHFDKGLTNRFFLVKRFFTCQMSSSKNMEHYVNKLNGMVEECNAIGAKVPPEVKVMVLLMSLPNSYKLLVTSYEVNLQD